MKELKDYLYYHEDGPPVIDIYCGDNSEILPLLPKVDLTVTSPPYDDIRDYGGFVFDFPKTAKALYEVSADNSCIVWVVGDKTENGSEKLTPFYQAIGFKEVGFKVHDTMIYLKDGFPFPEANRYQPIFEYMFVMAKGKVTFNPIKKQNIWGGLVYKERERGKDGKIHSDSDRYILHEGNVSNVWEYKVGYMKTSSSKISFQHPATFPEKLAKDHIGTWSNEGDTVLDPFVGSGTSAIMAKELKRNFIGIEVNEKYCQIAATRLKNTQVPFL